jgi:hypothetical protein
LISIERLQQHVKNLFWAAIDFGEYLGEEKVLAWIEFTEVCGSKQYLQTYE